MDLQSTSATQTCLLTRRRLLAASAAISTALAVRHPLFAAAWPPGATQAVGDFSGLVDIGGRSLYLEARGADGPTVVLEAGAGNNALIWDAVALAPGSGKTAVLPGRP
jgi:hypothetical protein